MGNESLLLLTVCAPLLGSLLLPLLGQISEKLRNGAALLMVAAALACAAGLLPAAIAGTPVTCRIGGLDLFQADRLAVFMALVSTLVGAIIVLYSFGYISHYQHRNEYYFMVVLFLGAMMGLVFARNLIAMYLCWEITAIVCWRLIGFFRDKNCVLKADKAFLVTVFGAVCMLLGFIMVYVQVAKVSGGTGSFDMEVIKRTLAGHHVSNWAVGLILLGIFSKSATVPLHTWLPDAGVAPSPVTALLHAAVLVKIGVYAYARLFLVTMPVSDLWQVLVPMAAAISALVSAGAALIETDLKRIIAYSTISQIAFIFLGLSMGGKGQAIGVVGGLLYILMHGISKGGLFLCAGIVEQNAKCRDITKLGGLVKVMPVTAVAFLLCAFSVMGIPPLGGFFSKYLVINGALTSGQLLVGFTFLAGAVLTILYLFRVFNLVFLGEARTDWVGQGVGEKSPTMVFSVGALAFLSVAAGLLVKWPFDFAQQAVQQMGIMQ
jgi:NADH:ubiquinone oxidoreductase subunit 5 (subunit L)/multisubunit Na+/H+ antiporter MnhA subunit